MFAVTVYSKPNCVMCSATYRSLDRLGLSYEVKDLSEPAQAEMLRYITEDLGYSQAPIVIVDGDEENHWSGFQPDRIKALALIPRPPRVACSNPINTTVRGGSQPRRPARPKFINIWHP